MINCTVGKGNKRLYRVTFWPHTQYCKMVKAVCGCLNVKINIKGELANSPIFHTDDLQFEESQDEFFQQAPKEVITDATGVLIEHTFLVKSRHVGNWNIYHCICCKTDTHAVPDSSQLPFLLNTALGVDANQISKLQQSERFSPVYKVVLPWLGNSGPSSPRNFPDKGSQADQAVATIQQMMSSFLKREEDKVEENILRYTEQQQASLSALEARARQDRNTLLLLLAQKETQLGKKMQSLSLRSEVTPPTTPTRVGSFSFTSPTKEIPPPPFQRGFSTNPDDDIFEFDPDYLDNRNPFDDTSDPDSEDSSYAEGMNIPGRQPLRSDDDSALAKSLPMRVPAMSNYRSKDIDIEDDRTPINPEEMEASFKAIARSVHGGSDSFWDLPRPRLNTLH
ncbi:uncharacterized protein LOC130692593 isoform X1 [Daphnia carinata]|uniref:uncharacterized protein LOC130692593 isoform X1 n=2 Tax=Daphnia carinata TaxID=120202 RepID=UPI00257CF6E2|nr:uncharacterized protein LOC130692593 isoform X1 [Daphnia carinata]